MTEVRVADLEADLEADLVVEDRGAVRLVRLERPATKNALTLDLVEALHEALAAAEDERSVRALVLSGVPGAFCSGADLRWLLREVENGGQVLPALERFQALTLRLVELSKPVVASVTGPAVGFGADLALAVPFGQASFSMDVGFVICAALLAYMSWTTYREQP